MSTPTASAQGLIWPEAAPAGAGHGRAVVGVAMEHAYGNATVVGGTEGEIGLSETATLGASAGLLGDDTGSPYGAVEARWLALHREELRLALWGLGGAVSSEDLAGAMVGISADAGTEVVRVDIAIPLYGVGVSEEGDGIGDTDALLPIHTELGASFIAGDHRIRAGVARLMPIVGYRYEPRRGFYAGADVGAHVFPVGSSYLLSARTGWSF